MNFTSFYIAYSLFAVCYMIWIVLISSRKFTTGLIAFWILSTPILNRDEYVIHTPWGFDLQPTRIFLLLGFCVLVVNVVKNIINDGFGKIKTKPQLFEYFLIGYVLVSSVVIISKAPGIHEMIPLVSGQIVFAVMYFISRDCLNERDRTILKKLVIIFGCLSVFVSMIQFLFFPNFFRIGSEREAFGSYIRANGFLFDEYDNGLFITCLTAIILFQKRAGWTKLLLTIFYGIGVLITMHRGSWLIFCISILVYIIIQITITPKYFKKLIVLPLYSCLFLGSLFFLIYPNLSNHKIVSQEFLQEQLFRDTLNIRLELVNLGISIIEQHPEGIGDFGFSSYGQLYYESGLTLHYGKPLIVHNGFIATFVKYGILGGLLFLLFFFSVLRSSLKQSFRNITVRFPILLISIALIIINITQDFSTLGTFPQIAIAFFLGELNSELN